MPIGASIVILNKEKEILLLKRSSLSRWMPNKWGLPGGKIEDGESKEKAAVRETLEETRLEVSPKDLFLLSETKKVVVYFTKVYNGVVIIDWEHSDWGWVKRKDLANYDAIPTMAELFDGALRYDKK